MDSSTVVAERFEDISARCGQSARPDALARNDQIVWYVVATRCEMDMEGFRSVFDQLLSERELIFLAEALEQLDESELAVAFRRAHSALRRAGFYDKPDAMCYEFGRSLNDELDEIENTLSSTARMWAIDDKLCQLQPGV